MSETPSTIVETTEVVLEHAPSEPRYRIDQEGAAECPNCGTTMRLWAAYYRCRNCGYKESCCF